MKRIKLSKEVIKCVEEDYDMVDIWSWKEYDSRWQQVARTYDFIYERIHATEEIDPSYERLYWYFLTFRDETLYVNFKLKYG